MTKKHQMSNHTQTVSVNGVSVRVDDEGRYNLNDLHAAAVINGQATESQKPSKFLRSSQIKRFIQAFSDEISKGQNCPLEENQPLTNNHGGNNQGVWAHELVAIRYAAWIDPKFEIRVYTTFKDAVLGELANLNQLNRLDLLIASESKEVSQCASKMAKWGSGGRKKVLNSARERMVDKLQFSVPGIE